MIRENSGELCLGPHAQMQKQKGPTAFCKDQGMAATKNPLATTWTDVGGFRYSGCFFITHFKVNMSMHTHTHTHTQFRAMQIPRAGPRFLGSDTDARRRLHRDASCPKLPSGSVWTRRARWARAARRQMRKSPRAARARRGRSSILMRNWPKLSQPLGLRNSR